MSRFIVHFKREEISSAVMEVEAGSRKEAENKAQEANWYFLTWYEMYTSSGIDWVEEMGEGDE